MPAEFDIDLHGLLRIRCAESADRFARVLRHKLCHLITRTSGPPDLYIEAVPHLAEVSRNDRMNMQVCRNPNDGQCCSAITLRGRTVMMVHPGPPLRVQYIPQGLTTGRCWAIMLQLLRRLLTEHDAMLCHGAVLAKDDQAVVLVGHRGQGKTQTVIRWLLAGWSYLAEDKFILRNGHAYAFENTLRLHGYHAELLPPTHPLRTRLLAEGPHWRRLLRRLNSLAAAYLPDGMVQRLHERLYPAIEVHANDIAPQARCLTEVALRTVYLLRPDCYERERLEPEQGMHAFAHLQTLAFAELDAFGHLIDYYRLQPYPDPLPALRRHLQGVDFYPFDPYHMDANA